MGDRSCQKRKQHARVSKDEVGELLIYSNFIHQNETEQTPVYAPVPLCLFMTVASMLQVIRFV